VKSLLFIIVVIVYLQYLEERSGKKKRSFFAAYIIRLANRFSLRSCDHFRNFLDVRVSIAKIVVAPLSSSFYFVAEAIGEETREGYSTYLLPRRARHRALLYYTRFRVSFQAGGVTGETETNKDKQLQISIPKLTGLPKTVPLNKVILIRYHRAWRATPHTHCTCMHARNTNTHACTPHSSLLPRHHAAAGGGKLQK
jgi:hypothetical protein